MLVGGLDIGTTGCKITVYDSTGKFICNEYREYNVTRKNGEHEIEADMIFEAVCDCLKETVKNVDIAAQVDNEILDETKNQQIAVEHVLGDVTNIKDIVYSNSATAEESAAASEQLTAQSDILKTLLQHIKLKR